MSLQANEARVTITKDERDMLVSALDIYRDWCEDNEHPIKLDMFWKLQQQLNPEAFPNTPLPTVSATPINMQPEADGKKSYQLVISQEDDYIVAIFIADSIEDAKKMAMASDDRLEESDFLDQVDIQECKINMYDVEACNILLNEFNSRPNDWKPWTPESN